MQCNPVLRPDAQLKMVFCYSSEDHLSWIGRLEETVFIFMCQRVLIVIEIPLQMVKAQMKIFVKSSPVSCHLLLTV